MRNLQAELENIINKLEYKPKLMIHACCAPCATYVIEYLKDHFEIVVLYYNPNIYPYEEYKLRENEVRKLCEYFSVGFLNDEWDNDKFNKVSQGLEDEKEGANRCVKCFELRFLRTAELAKKYNCEYFTSSLSISPLKNSQKIAEISEKIASEIGVKYLPSDFKKKNGYKRSVEISNELGLYRQNYCGCIFSKNWMK